jgi:hypothetical protein
MPHSMAATATIAIPVISEIPCIMSQLSTLLLRR